MGAFTDRPHALSPPSPVDENDNLNRVVTRAWIDTYQESAAYDEDALLLGEIPRRRGVALGDLLDAGESWEAADDGERNEWPVESVPLRQSRPRDGDRALAATIAEMEADEAVRADRKAERARRERMKVAAVEARMAEAKQRRDAEAEEAGRERRRLDGLIPRWATGEAVKVTPASGLRHYALNVLHGQGLTLDVGEVEKGEVTLREVASGARFAVSVKVVNAYRAGQPFPRAFIDRMLAARTDAFKAQSGLQWWEW